MLAEGLSKALRVFGQRGLFDSVGLREEDGVGTAQVGKPKNEIEVNLLGGDHGVDEDEDMFELLAFGDVFGDEGGEHVATVFRLSGVAVARKVDEVPGLGGDKEVVDELGFAGARRGLCQLFAGGDHVEEGRLAHVGASDEGDFRQRGLGASCQLGGGGEKGCLSDLHGWDVADQRRGRNNCGELKGE